MSYVRFDLRAPSAPAPPRPPVGWDAWAEDYARLGDENTAYALGKQVLHALVDEVAPPPRGREGWVLDFHCGAGDDLARFLDRGWRAAGCDGSAGMLRAAAARCGAALGDGRLELWQGRAEEIDAGCFGGRRFDLVFSATGGFAYLDDGAFVEVHRVLAGMLAPGGAMAIAHLTPFCAAESLYHLARLAPRRAAQRWAAEVPIEVRGQPLRMRLRSPRQVRRLLAGVARVERLAPILVFSPPFQSGVRLPARWRPALAALEQRAARVAPLAWAADQVLCVARAASSANSAR